METSSTTRKIFSSTARWIGQSFQKTCSAVTLTAPANTKFLMRTTRESGDESGEENDDDMEDAVDDSSVDDSDNNSLEDHNLDAEDRIMQV